MAAGGDATKNTTMALHVLIVVIRVKSCKVTNSHLSTHTRCDSASWHFHTTTASIGSPCFVNFFLPTFDCLP